jgi:hypothetical protein
MKVKIGKCVNVQICQFANMQMPVRRSVVQEGANLQMPEGRKGKYKLELRLVSF